MYLSSIKIKNLRCFKSAELSFWYPGRVAGPGETAPKLKNVNLLLGMNGSGKSTILKGIGMSLIAPVLQNSGFRAYSLVRRRFAKGQGRHPEGALVEAEVVLSSHDLGKSRLKPKQSLFVRLGRRGDSDTIVATTPARAPWSALFEDRSPAFMVLGYGANRWIAPPQENISTRLKDTQLRFQRVRGLFEDSASLVPLAHWYPTTQWNPGRKVQVTKQLDRLCGNQYHFTGETQRGELVFAKEGAKVPLPALSDGYGGFLGWIGDLLYHVYVGARSGQRLRDIEGIVMVDEIDLHLHPEWQRTIIATLSETFPKVQFIFTSHSPLVTGSLEWKNIWVMREGGPIQLPDEPIFGLSADQVLRSPYFNLDSTRPPEVADQLRLLDQRAQAGDSSAAVEFMQRLAYGSESQVFDKSRASAPAKRLAKKSNGTWRKAGKRA
jgi:hypothetical protein